MTRTGRPPTATSPAPSPASPATRSPNFRITAPANQRSATLDGWEFNVQHMFGESGFGVSANYTMVDSGLKYDNPDRRAVRAGGTERFGQPGRLLREGRLEVRAGLQLARRVPVRPFDGAAAEPDVHRSVRPARLEHRLQVERAT